MWYTTALNLARVYIKRRRLARALPYPIVYSLRFEWIEYGFYTQQRQQENNKVVSVTFEPRNVGVMGVDVRKATLVSASVFPITLLQAGPCQGRARTINSAMVAVHVGMYEPILLPVKASAFIRNCPNTHVSAR